MTTPVADFGTNTLDLSVNSVQLKLRMGETLAYELQFFSTLIKFPDNSIDYDNSIPIDISGWAFEAGIRDGSLLPHLAMDVKKYGPKGISSNSSVVISFDTSDLTTSVRANSTRDFYFEVQATVPTGIVDSEGDMIQKKQTVLVGIATMTANIYDATIM